MVNIHNVCLALRNGWFLFLFTRVPQQDNHINDGGTEYMMLE